jgi:hypothetical protein
MRGLWVKGHASNLENNRCDNLAVAAANSENLLVNDAYEARNPFPGVEQGGPAHGAGGENVRLVS